MSIADNRRWVMDTSTFSHYARAGHAELLHRLAPQGVILIPDSAHAELEDGRDRGYDIPSTTGLALDPPSAG